MRGDEPVHFDNVEKSDAISPTCVGMNRGGTMFCGKCGKEIQDDFTFCPYCGEKIYHGHSKSVEERPAVKTTRDALDVQKVSDSRKARAIVTLILFIIGTAFLLASKSI